MLYFQQGLGSPLGCTAPWMVCDLPGCTKLQWNNPGDKNMLADAGVAKPCSQWCYESSSLQPHQHPGVGRSLLNQCTAIFLKGMKFFPRFSALWALVSEKLLGSYAFLLYKCSDGTQ